MHIDPLGAKPRAARPAFLLALMLVLTSLMLSFPVAAHAATTLTTYPAPSGVALNTAYTVKVRVPGGAWQDLDEYSAKVDNYHPHNVSFVNFDTDGPVDVSVTLNSGAITSAVIRPTTQGITPTISGSTMTFSMSGPMKLSALVNGDAWNTLDIIANPTEVNPPSPTDPNVIYVGPGFYTGDRVVPSGKTLYIAGGAVINGEIFLDNTTNSKVIGRGIIYRPSARAISANYANQATIDGIIIDDYGFGDSGGNAIHLADTTNVTINNVTAYSGNKWGDGIDLFNASNVSINDIFMRTSDDSIAVYGSKPSGGVYQGNHSHNISVTNSILTPDTAHPINIGTHGDPSLPGGGGSIESLSFSNIDIWDYHQALQISVTASDGTVVSDVMFDNIRIDDHAPGRIADVLTFNNPGYGLGPGRGVNNVYFKNVSYTGSNANVNQIYGNSASRLTQDVTFENLTVNGTVITSASAGNFTVGNYTNDVNFIATGGSVPAPVSIPHYTSTNLALNKPASTDSAQTGNPASGGNDASTATNWTANDGNPGHWWTVDLGSNKSITEGTQVRWPGSGAYQYKIETSLDGANWTLKSDRTDNTDPAQTQNDLFYDMARYVRITVVGMPSGASASISDFKVLGEPINLALGKSASADSTKSGFPASNGNDGNPTTLWSANDGNTGHSFKVDLGNVKNITYGTQVAWPAGGAAYQYKIETSNDNTNWALKVDKTANTDTSQVQNDVFAAQARYVRITVTGLPSGAWASLYDFKIFGDPVNLALGKVATSDSEQAGSPAGNANDTSISTGWSANDTATGHWWKVDLGHSMNITGGTEVMWGTGGAPYKYKIETSGDDTNWTTMVDKTNPVNSGGAQLQADYFTGNAQFVRITVTGMPSGARAALYDVKVLGDTGDTATMALLPFDEATGTTAYDNSGNEWSGTLANGASRVAGKSGNAVDLNGTNQYVSLPSGVVATDDTVTVATWVNLDTVSNWSRIFDFGSGKPTQMFITPRNGTNGKIRFTIKNNNSAEQVIDGQAALPTGSWHHVAVTLNGSTGILYVDGVQVGTNTGMTFKPSTLGVTTQNWIGRSQYSVDPYLDGKIDDFRIYNRALSPVEIGHVMSGLTALPSVEVPFNESSGTTASDVSGNGWTGTLTGGATFVAGTKGNAVDLSGSSQYASLPTGLISSAKAITVTAWVNLDSVTTWARIFDFGSGTTQNMFLMAKNGTNGFIRAGVRNGSEQDVDGTAALPAGGWHHVAVTLDGTTGTIYVDGAKAASGRITIKPSDLGADTKNYLGRSQYSTDPYLDGKIDEFRIYNRALTAAEVAAVMNE
ncbi:LamG-like jellyroll fold domain-containing protein [Streptomyces graminilatus]|uniref:LamG-like jellyroll fold domain-containing protein n=1 Tax=Streptomyces graminilatus TaxID=1464070 RepID=UPI0006E459BB|nr:LamG-like jellyroll fold domain-containing protein [Streptomyces graminilatus]